MKKYSAFVFFILMFALGESSIAEEKENEFFDRKISVFNSEEELFDFFKEMEEYNQTDKIYSEEKRKASEEAQKILALDIVDGLSADEIGDIPVLTIGGDSSIYSLDIELKPYNEYLLACLLYTSPSPRDLSTSRMPSSA